MGELQDTLLNHRLIRIIEAMSEQAEAAISQTCGKAGAKAAYRFFGNRRVQEKDILVSPCYLDGLASR